MQQSMYDIFDQYLIQNPEEAKMLEGYVTDALSAQARINPGASVTRAMVDSMIDEIYVSSGMHEDEAVEVGDYFDEPTVEVFAQPRRGFGHRPYHHSRHRRFPPFYGFGGRDLIRFLLLNQLLR